MWQMDEHIWNLVTLFSWTTGFDLNIFIMTILHDQAQLHIPLLEIYFNNAHKFTAMREYQSASGEQCFNILRDKWLMLQLTCQS
jgi:hypothetical protein